MEQKRPDDYEVPTAKKEQRGYRMIYCVEDERNIRELLVYTLETTGFEAEGFETGAELDTAMKKNMPELILLDIMLPGEDGYNILKRLKSDTRTRDIPVIMVTAKEAEFDKVKGLEGGADDYITKPFNILEVKARMKAIMRRVAKKDGMSASGKVVVKGDLKIDCESRRVFSGDRELNLTAKEFDLLELLAMNPNKVYSRESLLNIVWGYEYPGDARTVDVHIRRLREKIEVNPSDPKYVYTKWGVGYYFRG